MSSDINRLAVTQRMSMFHGPLLEIWPKLYGVIGPVFTGLSSVLEVNRSPVPKGHRSPLAWANIRTSGVSRLNSIPGRLTADVQARASESGVDELSLIGCSRP